MNPFFLLAILMLSIFYIFSPKKAKAQEILPKEGDKVNGFTVLSIKPEPLLGATAVHFTHDKTGAELLYLSSNDQNCSFSIAFRTPALDNKGKPHVFEHITISGSQRYPHHNLFFPVMNKAYQTFLNAFTAHGLTMYPAASLSEPQLFSLMDYYLSGVFEPLLYLNPTLAKREAWRYELQSEEAPLTIAGTVYSEMQGAMTPSALASFNSLVSSFEGGKTAYESGGLPADIATISYEELLAFHQAYYHPSNALITLYGDMDYANFLAHIDKEYLANYTKKEICVEKGRITPYQETRYYDYEVPVSSDATTKDASYLYYNFIMEGATFTETLEANLLSIVLNSQTAPLQQRIRKELPHVSASVRVDIDSPSPVFECKAQNANPEDRDIFVQIVEDTIAHIAKEGIAPEILDLILAQNKLVNLLMSEDNDLGVSASTNISVGWTYFGTVDSYQLFHQTSKTVTQETLLKTLEKWLLHNPYRAVSVSHPVKGRTEEIAKELEENLATYKATLPKETLCSMVKAYEEYTKWTTEEVPEEILKKLLVVEVSSLPEGTMDYPMTDEIKEGIRYIKTTTPTMDVGKIKLYLDASTIPVNALQNVQLYLNLLGNIATSTYTREMLNTKVKRYLPALEKTGTYLRDNNNEERYYTALSWTSLVEDYTTAVNLLAHMLTQSDFTDVESIRYYLTTKINDFSEFVDNYALYVQIGRAKAMHSDMEAVEEHCSGIANYLYMKEMLTLLENDPSAFAKRMQSAMKTVLNAHGATITMAGDGETLTHFDENVAPLLSIMENEVRQKVDYSVLRLKAVNEALINNVTVHMNIAFAKCDEVLRGKREVISALINDLYMLPVFRNSYGAYGAFISVGKQTMSMYTYRDPQCKDTFDRFTQLPEFLKNAPITQEVVDQYIIGAYTNLVRSAGGLTGGAGNNISHFMKFTKQDRLAWQQNAKNTKPEDVFAFATLLEKSLKNATLSTSGTESTIGESMEIFQNTIRI